MKFSHLAPNVLRIGLAAVFLWFGLSELLSPAMWTSYIPDWLMTMTGLSALPLVIINGLFEVLLAVLLVFGIWTRAVAFLLFVHLIGIIVEVGLGAIGIRDIGLAFALFSIVLQGNGPSAPKVVDEEHKAHA